LPQKELILTSKKALKVARALSSATNVKILELLSKERQDVSTIARRLNLSEAYISQELSVLEDLQLIKASYSPGKRSIRKICELAVGKITIEIKP